MELKEMAEKTLELFGVLDIKDLGAAMLDSCNDHEKLEAFSKMVDHDLSVDHVQKIYQYYLADRKEKKQDYTPSSIALFMGLFVKDCENIIDMCAGSGALIIQKWNDNKDACFTAIEYDDNVIPFLVFNMVLRNIQCRIIHGDALSDDKPKKIIDVRKGKKFANIINI